MKKSEKEMLMSLSRKYIWWKTPEEAVEFPSRVIAQVMNIGDYADVQRMANIAGDDTLRDVLIHAEIGQFSERSWNYWHYRLGIATLDHVPPLPTRILMTGQKKTIFGLPVVRRGNDQGYVRVSDIRSLPFFEFWEQGARGTTQLIDEDGEALVFLYDWEAFCKLFIETGKHRLMT